MTADYAKENYARAYKRIQIIITFLHGEQPENVNLTTAEETADAAEQLQFLLLQKRALSGARKIPDADAPGIFLFFF